MRKMILQFIKLDRYKSMEKQKPIKFLINHRKVLSVNPWHPEAMDDTRIDITFEGGHKESFYCKDADEAQLYMRELSKYMMGGLEDE